MNYFEIPQQNICETLAATIKNKLRMIIKQRYETRMTPKEIESWIQRKKDEKTGLIIKIRKYVARSSSDGFMIREKRLNKYQSFMPRIIGKYASTLNTTKIDLKIIPSYTGIIFFSVFLLGFPIAILSTHSVKINGAMTSDLNDKLGTAGLILLIVIPIMLWALIRPTYNAKEWIERELRLNKTE